MQNSNRKFEAKWEELLKSTTSLTMAVEKGKSTGDLRNPQHVPMTMVARTDASIQIMEFQMKLARRR